MLSCSPGSWAVWTQATYRVVVWKGCSHRFQQHQGALEGRNLVLMRQSPFTQASNSSHHLCTATSPSVVTLTTPGLRRRHLARQRVPPPFQVGPVSIFSLPHCFSLVPQHLVFSVWVLCREMQRQDWVLGQICSHLHSKWLDHTRHRFSAVQSEDMIIYQCFLKGFLWPLWLLWCEKMVQVNRERCFGVRLALQNMS